MSYPVIDPVGTGERIREMIGQTGVTVTAVSEYLGINRSSLYKALRGDTVLSLDNIYALSVYLGVSVNEMIIAIRR